MFSVARYVLVMVMMGIVLGMLVNYEILNGLHVNGFEFTMAYETTSLNLVQYITVFLIALIAGLVMFVVNKVVDFLEMTYHKAKGAIQGFRKSGTK